MAHTRRIDSAEGVAFWSLISISNDMRRRFPARCALIGAGLLIALVHLITGLAAQWAANVPSGSAVGAGDISVMIDGRIVGDDQRN